MGGFGNYLPQLSGVDPKQLTDEQKQKLIEQMRAPGSPPPQAPSGAGFDPLKQSLQGGTENIKKGIGELMAPPPFEGATAADPEWWEPRMQGVVDIGKGVTPWAALASAPFAAAAPLETLAGLGVGTTAGAATQFAGEEAGMSPAQSSLLGMLSGGVAGGIGAKPTVEGLSGLSEQLEPLGQAALQRVREALHYGMTGEKPFAMPLNTVNDLAIWGASKVARGVNTYAKWRAEMRRELDPDTYNKLEPNLEKIWDKAQKKYASYIEYSKGLPTARKIAAMYRQGEYGRYWYQNTYKRLKQLFGDDAPFMIDSMAANSQIASVPSGVTKSLNSYRQWKGGEQFTGLEAVRKNLEKAARGEPLSGPKIGSFKKNLMGDPMPVTVDRWISRIFGYKDSPTQAQYKFMDYWITQMAQKAGVPPREFQAALWAAARDAEGASSSGEAMEVLLNQRLGRTPQGRALRAELMKLKQQTPEPRPEFIPAKRKAK